MANNSIIVNDHLKIIQIIGRGSYGTIFLCKNSNKNIYCVLKEIQLNNNVQALRIEEAKNEILVLSNLNHPFIIKFYESFLSNVSLYICMEFATLGNLAQYMFYKQAQYLQSTEILYIFCQILLGVSHIHEKSIIHRDIKAENIFLSETSVGTIVKIGDFGISKILGNDKTNTVIGTPYYLAPELCENNSYDSKTDIWAMGCLLYEICTHQRAFDSPTLIGLVKRIVSGKFIPINTYVYETAMQELIESMLTVLPEKRASTADLLKKPFLFPMLCTIQTSLTHFYSYI